MPCPFFEPVCVVTDRTHQGARLPLIDEYEGRCRAAVEPITVPVDLRFRACNHGYSRQLCGFFPPAEVRSSIRFNVVGLDGEIMELLCVEERDYAPHRWTRFRYCIHTGSVDPGIADVCAQAQLVAFCRSYLKRFA
jgi:hypothetical protein